MTEYAFRFRDVRYGVTPVPNVFIDEYMPSADGNFVKVYITGFMESLNNSRLSGDSLSKRLGLLESDILKAWEYWESKGLVRLVKSGSDAVIEFVGLSSPNNTAVPVRSDVYSAESIHSNMENPKIKDMFENIEKLIGRTISSKEISMYLSWINDYSFAPEVIILLIEYCKSKGKADSRYIEKVAMSWHDSNITSIDDAQKYISKYEERYSNNRLVLDFLGLKENDVMKPQEEFLDKWFNTWNFSIEMVLEACKICSLRINEPNFSYIDGILSNWYKNGYRTLKDIESLDSKKKSKNTKFKAPVTTFNSYEQRTYDIKELEKRLLGRSEEIDDEQ